MKITAKRYKCDRCGHVVTQSTNHYGATWSAGRVNTCPQCPPWAKYAEFGGATRWTCLETPLMPEANGTEAFRLLERAADLLQDYRARDDQGADLNDPLAMEIYAFLKRVRGGQ